MAQPHMPNSGNPHAPRPVNRAIWLAIREAVTGRRYRATEALAVRPAQAALPAVRATGGVLTLPPVFDDAGPGE